MRSKHPCRVHVLLTTLFSACGTAGELAPLSSIDLHQECLKHAQSAESSPTSICSAYVRGFIEGSHLVELEDVSVEGETFTQRAFRTRIGATRAIAARYCLDSSLTLEAFILQLLVQADDQPPREGEGASSLLYATLARYHGCSRQEGR
jgi:hypothetical protein